MISTISICVCSVLIIIVLLLTYYADNVGNFTIDLDKDAFNKYGLSLSETADFKDPSSRLIATSCEYAEPIGNISDYPDEILPNEILTLLNDGLKDGSNNGDAFLSYSFYIRNAGTEVVDYSFTIDIDSVANYLDEAIRVLIIKEVDVSSVDAVEVRNIYAKRQSVLGANPDLPELGTTPFLSTRSVVTDILTGFNQGRVDRYSIILWIEGNDADCVNEGERSILDGQFKLSFKFKLLKQE